MTMNATGAFVIPWLDCYVDGVPGPPLSGLEPGANFAWRGVALRVDGPQSILPLGSSLDDIHKRRQAATDHHIDPLSPPLCGAGFTVTNGSQSWAFSLIDRGPGRSPLCLTLDGPPSDTRSLWVMHCVGLDRIRPTRPASRADAMVCFTPGAMISTSDGPRPVEHIDEGDVIDTKDNGPQEVLWRGEKHLTGAGLHARPELAPVQIGRNTLGVDIPDQALLVSPDHRVVLHGERARSLFNRDEVLVAARDLIDGASIRRVMGLNRLRYIHLALAGHQIVFANGVETESFDPGAMSLDTLSSTDLNRLKDRIPHAAQGYGRPARRVLTLGEATILRRDAGLTGL